MFVDHYSEIEKYSVNLVYADIPFGTGKQQKTKGHDGYYDGSVTKAVEFVDNLLYDMEHYAAEGCTVLIHCDHRSKWRVKQLIDVRASQRDLRFRDEIAWCYHSGGASKYSLPKKWDSILYLTRGADPTYNVVREPYKSGNVVGRPGFNSDGKMVTNWWDIGIMSTTSKERTGYPNQKPLTLMRRVVEMFSNPGDVVLDPCCGSGSTLVAAQELDRKWVGIDTNPEAITLAKERLGV